MIQVRLFTFGFLLMLAQLLIGGESEDCVLEEMETVCGDLEVMIEKDCYSAELDGIATYYIVILSGTPPFTVEILYPSDGGQYTLQDVGFIEYSLEDGVHFEVLIKDSTGQEFFDVVGEIACTKLWNLCEYAYSSVNYGTTCIGNGKVAIQINSDYQDAYYIDSNGGKYTLNSIDTIPNLSYVAIEGTNNYIKDFFVNCLAANDDLVEVLEGETITFNVLDNDFGQNIQLTEIIEIPQCGELLEWTADGMMSYRMEEGEDCSEDEMVYELKNDLGEIAVASVHFQKSINRPIHLTWELEWNDHYNRPDFYFSIEDGKPPYTITGSYNDLLEEDYFYFLFDCGYDVVFEISDSDGETVDFELKYTGHFCNGDDCYEPLFAYQYLDVECLGEQGGVLHFLDRMQPTLLEKAFYIDSNNEYHDLQELDTIPNNSYYYLELQYFGHIDGYVDCEIEEIKAVDDFAVTNPGEAVTLNILDNDSGEEIRLVGILVTPSCGTIMQWSEDGEVVYVADPNTSCTFDTFVYEVEDNCGNKGTAMVTIAINQPPTELIVEVERDCASLETNMEYTLNIAIGSGSPPFFITMNEHQDTLQNYGIVSYRICEGTGYEVTVIDGMEQEFYELGGEIACTGQYSPCERGISTFDYETTCLGDGKIAIELIDEYLEAHYTNNKGVRYLLNTIDTIPDVSYLTIQMTKCVVIDTLVSCLSANDDFIEMYEEIIYFNVLENDFGQNIEVTAITSPTQCGTLYSWSPDGTMSYSTNSQACNQDEFIYELQNDIGEKTTAKVQIQEINEQPMYLDWRFDCAEVGCEFDFYILGGVPPYVVKGSFNDIVEHDYFTLTVHCWDFIELEVIDSEDEITYFTLNTWNLCFGDENCYEPESIDQYLEVECLGEQGAVVHYLSQMQITLLKQAFYIDSNNDYHELQDLDTIPDHSYYYLEMQNLGHIDGYVDCGMEEIEAIDDFAQTHPGEPVFLNVLANDKGDGIRLTQILVAPFCGEVVQWSEDGEVVYVADPGTNCVFDTFTYEIVDNWGEKDAGEVVIAIEQFSGFLVETEKDCSNSVSTGVYILYIAINYGTAPYAVNLNGIQDTLFQPGILSYEIFNAEPYELHVQDSLGQEFYETGGELPCPYWWDLCEESNFVNKEITCLGNGKVAIEIKSNFETANYIDTEGIKHTLNTIDTIPNLSYVTITLSNNYVWDDFLNCLSANNDSLRVLEEEEITFNVLDNDFGQNIQISDIIEMPQCGDLLEWFPDGTMRYQMEENENCMKDKIVYEVANDLGEKATASIHFQKINTRPMYLDWDLDCDDDWQCEISVNIIDGIPPYFVEGYFNEQDLETSSISFPFECGEPIKLEITDNDGEIAFFELDNYYHICFGVEDCYEPRFIHQFLQIECLSEQGGILQYQPRMIPNLIEQAFYIDSNNQYHKLQEFDTIPNHSYYYLKMKYFGHIDGYVDCLMTNIENTGENPSNISLQLYPNPNSGQFSLQLHTPPTLSIQSFPVRIYDIAGRLVKSGEVHGNQLEELVLENAQSGLYLLQVILEEEVLVRRFVVE